MIDALSVTLQISFEIWKSQISRIRIHPSNIALNVAFWSNRGKKRPGTILRRDVREKFYKPFCAHVAKYPRDERASVRRNDIGRSATRYCRVRCALYDFALIFEISVSYMTCYPCRWHLARILRRIIAHKKFSQYCHVIKEGERKRGRERERERERERSSGECISACRYVCREIASDIELENHWNPQIPKSLRHIGYNRKFCRFTT